MSVQRSLPLLLAGTIGLSLIGFGLTGLSGVEPQLRAAEQTWQQERTPSPMLRFVDCHPGQRPIPAPAPEV